jgi:hypothetical protein
VAPATEARGLGVPDDRHPADRGNGTEPGDQDKENKKAAAAAQRWVRDLAKHSVGKGERGANVAESPVSSGLVFWFGYIWHFVRLRHQLISEMAVSI